MTDRWFPTMEVLQARNTAQAALHAEASRVGRAEFGSQVFVRGVVEVSNYCRENCHYCGMRRDNRSLERFRAKHDELAELLIHQRPRSITDVNIQAGEDMQPQGHVQVLINLIDFGMNLQEAGDAPRIYHTGSSEPTGERMTDGGSVNLESGFPAESVLQLEKRGHRFGKIRGGAFGGYQAILWDSTNRVYVGASESRKDGQAAGY